MDRNLEYNQIYDVGGIIVIIKSNDRQWLEAVKASVSSPPASGQGLPDLNIDLIETSYEQAELMMPLPGDDYKINERQVILDQPVNFANYQQDEQTWQEIHGYGRIWIDYEKGRAAIYRFRERHVTNPFFADIFFVINLMQRLMICRQFYAIHAACVEVKGKGVIFTGPGGRGKSTSCYALARRGHPTLNDEKILLKLNESYQAYSVSDVIKVRKTAVDKFFPELIIKEPFYMPNYDEFCYKAGIMPGMKSTVECSADFLLIMKQVDRPESAYKQINPARVVGELFPVTMNPQNIKSNTEKFNFLTDFLQHVNCYQIDFGYDMDQFAQLIENLVQQNVQSSLKGKSSRC